MSIAVESAPNTTAMIGEGWPARSRTDLGAVPAVAREGCPLAEFRDRLRRVGLRPTAQRVALGWLLFGRGDRHVTAEGLFEEASKARLPVSLSTVYNTLNQFTDVGLLRKLFGDASKTCFDTNTTEHHHYLIEDTDEVIDLPGPCVLRDPVSPPEGMEICGIEVIVRLRRKAT